MASGAEALGAALSSVAERAREVADAVEAAAVELGLRIAEQAMGAAVDVDPDRVVDVVRGALRRLVERERVTILVNPEDLDTRARARRRAHVRARRHRDCDVQAERRVGRGGAVVRTVGGRGRRHAGDQARPGPRASS